MVSGQHHFDMVNKLIHLYGEATIHYQTMDLAADYILIDMNGTHWRKTWTRFTLAGERDAVFKDRDQKFYGLNIRYILNPKGIVPSSAPKRQTSMSMEKK